MVEALAHPMDTAERDEEIPLLLFCPDQGGWQIGIWFGGHWVDYSTLTMELQPTRWMPVPPNPVAP